MERLRLLRLFLIQVAVITIFLVPVLGAQLAFAEPLVPCGGRGQQPCEFNFLVTLIQNITNFLLILAVPVSAVLFAYAGFQYIFAAGDMGKIKKAHEIFWSVFIGLVFMASAWLIVKIIVDTLDPEGTGGGGQFLRNL